MESCSSLFEHEKSDLLYVSIGNKEHTLQSDLPALTVACLFITLDTGRNAIFTSLPKSVIEEIVILVETMTLSLAAL